MHFSIGIYFESDRTNVFHRTDFLPQYPYQPGEIFKSHTNMNINISIGICRCPIDPKDSIGSAYYTNIQYDWNFIKSLTNSTRTFPLESVGIRWNQPNVQYITNRTWTFPSVSVCIRWITSINRPLHIYTSSFPIEDQGIRLESGRQYWTTLMNDAEAWGKLLCRLNQTTKSDPTLLANNK